MKFHSVQFKFLTTVISAMLAITIFIGGISIYEVDNFVQTQTGDFVDAMAEKEASQVNDIFGDMEKSVKIIESYMLHQIENIDSIKNRDKRNEIIKNTDKMFAEVAKQTDSAIAYYIRFAPELSDSKSGLFYSKTNDNDKYSYFEPTDLYIYNKDDTEHVGWYWQPYEAGKPVWMKPYYNKNNGIFMISYVVPLYCENQFVGVVGMDFDYTVLMDRVNKIKIYEHGFAYLEMDGIVMHHKDYEIGDKVSDTPEEYLQVSKKLVNGMNLVLSASNNDIRQIRYSIALKILYVAAFLAVLFSLIVIIIVKRIVGPLKKLTEASKKLSSGNYDVEIAHSNTYEIKLLSTAFENMTMHLREHKKMQHILAYRDSLTGIRNTTSYNAWVADFDREMKNKDVSFGVVVLDVNWLKETNDSYGHDMGNKLLVTASHIITDVFKRSPVFRIGGDEFLVILQGKDLEECEELFAKFDLECINADMKSAESDVCVSIAKGFARYDRAVDTQFADVFNRADDAMYKNKKEMKNNQMPKLHAREMSRMFIPE